MNNLKPLDYYRVPLMGDMGNEGNGCFKMELNGVEFTIIASNGLGWDHVSVSSPNRVPSYDELVHFKKVFFKDTEVCYQLFVPESEHINNHSNCLHLWRSQNKEMPLPPAFMVGVKSLGVLK